MSAGICVTGAMPATSAAAEPAAASNVFVTTNPNTYYPASLSYTIIGTLKLPAGNYLLSANVYAFSNVFAAESNSFIACVIWNGTGDPSTSTQAPIAYGGAGTATSGSEPNLAWSYSIPLQGYVELTAAANITLQCHSNGGEAGIGAGASLHAVRAGPITVQ
jgi:hypothetical protein